MQYTQLCFIVKQITGKYKLVLSEHLKDLHGKIKQLWGLMSVTVEAIAHNLRLLMSHKCQPPSSTKDPLQVGNYVVNSLLCR
jgi:hypothetical protein